MADNPANFNFTVDCPAPSVSSNEPIDTVGIAPENVGCIVTDTTYGLDETSLRLVARSPSGKDLIAITGGAIQAGWTGRIVATGTPIDTIAVVLDGYPSELNLGLWTFLLDINNLAGKPV